MSANAERQLRQQIRNSRINCISVHQRIPSLRLTPQSVVRVARKAIRIGEDLMLTPIVNAPADVTSLKVTHRWLIQTGALLLCTVWAFWPTLSQLMTRWSIDPQYSHGFFVPILAIAIAWFRRMDVGAKSSTPIPIGLVWILVGLTLYGGGAYIAFDWLQAIALLPVLAGISMIVGGRWLLSVVWPSILFLLFMVPLPYRLEVSMAHPLQKLAGMASTFALQTLGVVATRNGNLLNIEGHVLGVAEACSGLRMLVVFFALSTAMTFLGRRSWMHNVILICSAVPVALVCNIGRITITGLLYLYAGESLAERVFHDLAGWLMMPAALLMLCLEMKYVDLVIDTSAAKQLSVAFSMGTFQQPLIDGRPTS